MYFSSGEVGGEIQFETRFSSGWKKEKVCANQVVEWVGGRLRDRNDYYRTQNGFAILYLITSLSNNVIVRTRVYLLFNDCHPPPLSLLLLSMGERFTAVSAAFVLCQSESERGI